MPFANPPQFRSYRPDFFWHKNSSFRSIDFSNNTEKKDHDQVVDMVKKLIKTKNQLSAAKTDRDQDYFSNQLDAINARLNQSIFNLYGLITSDADYIMGQVLDK